MLIQGTVPDTVGLGQDAGQRRSPGCCRTSAAARRLPRHQRARSATYFRGANTTQYGGKSSISMEGTTGSENTGKAAGAAALVVSAARDAHAAGQLRPDETREILEQTAERVTTGNTAGTGTPDPGADADAPSIDQWTTHFGWGRVDLGAAVAVAQSGKIPPEAAIDSPDWYAPLTGNEPHDHRPRPGPLRDRQQLPLEARVGRRRGAHLAGTPSGRATPAPRSPTSARST